MSCQIDQKKIEDTVRFHGHTCPGLTIGIRAAELALHELAGSTASDLVCVTETDMCGVDAIQFLTGCTYGKGNLIHRDYGKMAFSFYDRKSGKGIRLLLRDDARGEHHEELTGLMAKNMHGELNDSEQERLHQLRQLSEKYLLQLPLEQVFHIEELANRPPRPARVLESLVCASCGEKTMESRTRRFAGKILCVPCFDKVEQKV